MGRPERLQFRIVLERVVEQVTIDRLGLCVKERAGDAAALASELRVCGELGKRVFRCRIGIRWINRENTVELAAPKSFLIAVA